MNTRESWSHVWLAVLGVALAGAAAAVYLPAGGPGRVWAAPFFILGAAALAGAIWARRQSLRTIATQQQQIDASSSLRLQVVEALSLAIDARHRSTQSVRREQRFAAALAQAFGMSPDEVDGVRTAALLHDIGKLAVPDHILTKPGPLDTDEQRKIRTHPDVGAGIIAAVPFPYPVASLVRGHHERWDGTGYPAGLRGTDIPLGARILACVDQYEALTVDRPFHEALSPAAALDVLWSEAGKALDPVVVARFAEILPALEPPADGRGAAARRLDAGAGVDAGDRALRDIAAANSEIFRLYDMSQAIGTTLGVADAMTVFTNKLQHLVPFDACALFLHDAAHDVFHCRFAAGAAADRVRQVSVPWGDGAIGAAAATRTCAVSLTPGTDTTALPADEGRLPFASLLACPLIVSDSVVGVLALCRREADPFSDDHQRIVNAVSAQAAAVILNSVVFEQTQTDSVTDALTGLPNIRMLFVHLSRELARSSRHDSPVALFLLDLDNLKYINDTFGHSTGDHALCKVATTLAGSIRPYDLCVRYGGDEFIVVLSGCGRDEAVSKLRELQAAIDGIAFEAADHQRVRLAASGGAAVFPDDGRSYEALLALADRRMYQDKANRKRGTGRPADRAPAGYAAVELDRAAQGVL